MLRASTSRSTKVFLLFSPLVSSVIRCAEFQFDGQFHGQGVDVAEWCVSRFFSGFNYFV